MTQMLLFSSCITSQENQWQPQKALQISAVLIPSYTAGAAVALAEFSRSALHVDWPTLCFVLLKTLPWFRSAACPAELCWAYRVRHVTVLVPYGIDSTEHWSRYRQRIILVVVPFSKAGKKEFSSTDTLLLLLSLSRWFPRAQKCKGQVNWTHRVLPISESGSLLHLPTTSVVGQQRQSLKESLPKHE